MDQINVPQSVFSPAGPVAQTQLNLLSLTMWIAIGIFIVVGTIILYTVVRFRAKPGDGTPKQIEGNTKLEIAWTIVPIILLTTIAVPTVRDAFYVDTPPDPENALNITVTGYQWWWSFEYPDNDDIVTANEMRIPVGQPIHLTLQSADVVHSFWVPRLAGKVDVVPGRFNTMWLQADTPGIYYGQCAEFCGTSHANMRFRVVALDEAEWEQWLTTRQTVAAVGPLPDTMAENDLVRHGHDLFMASACVSCHTIDGTPARGVVGPNLTDFASRTTLAAGILENNEANLAKWLDNPPAVKPGALMPSHGFNEQQIQALVAFLGTLH